MDPYINLDGVIFHKPCAKCEDCNCQITISNFVKNEAADHTVLLCKTHYLKRFKEVSLNTFCFIFKNHVIYKRLFIFAFNQGGTGYLGSEKYKMQTKHGASMKPPNQVPQLLSTASPVPPPLSATKKFLQELFASPSKGGMTNSQSPGKKFFDGGDDVEKNVPSGIEPRVIIAPPIQPKLSPKASPSKYDSFLNKSKEEYSTDVPMKSIPVQLPLSTPPTEHPVKINIKTLETTKLTIITQIDDKRETRNDSLFSSSLYPSLSPSTSPVVDSRMTSNYSSPVVPFSTLNSPDLFCQSTSSLSSSRYSSPLEQSSTIPDSPLPLPQSKLKPIPSIITHIPSSSDDTTSSIPCTPLESSYNLTSPTIISPIDSRSSSSPTSPLPISSHSETVKIGRSNFTSVRTLSDSCPAVSETSVSPIMKNEKLPLPNSPLKQFTLANNSNRNSLIISSTSKEEPIAPSSLNNSLNNSVNNSLNNSLSKTNSPFDTFTQSSTSTTVQSGTVQSHLKFFNNNSTNSNSNNNKNNDKINESTPTTTEQQIQQQQQQQLDLQQSQLKRSLTLTTPVRHFVPPTISASNSDKNLFNTLSPPQPVSPSQRKSVSYKDFLNTNANKITNTDGNVNKNVNTVMNTNINSNTSGHINNENNNSVRVQSMEQKKSWRVTNKEVSTSVTSSMVGKPITVNRSVLSRYDPNHTSNVSDQPKTQ